ncbi:hypothetical protein KCV26_09385 [Petrimonas sulfuriphila]|uniref:Cap15 family cyclic dinucleotide receptor domain-containing protein n=1 Tax=Petrimonas sulfuriphila TaxID=285070 RepID=UPI0032484120
MVKYNVDRYIAAIVILSIALFLLISSFRNNLNFNDLDSIWEDVTTTVTIVTLICTLFVLWGWRCKIFKGWLVPFPCLSGKWRGVIKSTYNHGHASILVDVVIKHHFFNIQIKIKTNESSSISTCGSFDIDEDRGLNQLIYTYQNNPKATVRDCSGIHYGTTRLEICDDAKTLEGEYWTSRKTTGDIQLTKIN